MTIYDFTAKDAQGAEIALADYQGKVLLIVNTATACGFTPQYDELQSLYEKYQPQGLEILDFPCNQFGNQSPGTEEEIVSFCQANFGVTFKQFAKIEVNGENEHPLFAYLKAEKGFTGFSADHPLSAIVTQVVSQIDPDYANNSNIKWNFTKFLVDRSGNVVARFEPMDAVSEIEKAIAELLQPTNNQEVHPMNEVYEFLKNAGVYFLATTDGDQPRVRPFGTVDIFEGKLYIQTGKVKNVATQLNNNPKVEISATLGDKWIRITANAVLDENIAAQEHMLAAYPSLQAMYKPGDGNTAVYYLANATAQICSFTEPAKIIDF